jgi:hypothetical protein
MSNLLEHYDELGQRDPEYELNMKNAAAVVYIGKTFLIFSYAIELG